MQSILHYYSICCFSSYRMMRLLKSPSITVGSCNSMFINFLDFDHFLVDFYSSGDIVSYINFHFICMPVLERVCRPPSEYLQYSRVISQSAFFFFNSLDAITIIHAYIVNSVLLKIINKYYADNYLYVVYVNYAQNSEQVFEQARPTQIAKNTCTAEPRRTYVSSDLYYDCGVQYTNFSLYKFRRGSGEASATQYGLPHGVVHRIIAVLCILLHVLRSSITVGVRFGELAKRCVSAAVRETTTAEKNT